MKKTVLKMIKLAAAILLTCCLPASAQKNDLPVLKSGDYIPQITLNKVINYPTGSIKMSDLKGKLVIFDFWNVRCSACIENFAHLDSLQDKFKDKLQVILVTYNNEEQVRSLMLRSRLAGRTRLPIVVSDSLLYELLPPRMPHHAWISPEGKILAITDPYNAKEDYIRAALQGQHLSLSYIPPDIINTSSLPIFSLDQSVFIDHLRQYSCFLTRSERFGTSGGPVTDTVTGKVTRLQYYNAPLLALYKMAFGGFYEGMSNRFGVDLNTTRVSIECRDADRFKWPAQEQLTDKWLNENTWCYESAVPPALSEKLPVIMQQDLERFFNVRGSIEKRKIRCLALVTYGRTNRLATKGVDQPIAMTAAKETVFSNRPMQEITNSMETLLGHKWAIVDQTHHKGNVDFILPGVAFSSLATARQSLRRQGLDLVQGIFDADVLVIKDVK